METIKGYVESIHFTNAENGFMIFDLISEGMETTCKGTCKGLGVGETIVAEGGYEEHPQYGRQFKIKSFRIEKPQDADGIERYLASGAVKGIGAALAARIVKRFGEDTFRIIEEEPERLTEVKGISERKAREIAVQMEEKQDLRDAMIFLQQYGISNTLAIKIYDTYGLSLYSVIQENPYRLAEDVNGIGFRIADELAARIGIRQDSAERIRSGILYTLMQAVGEGHTYLPMEMLKERASGLLGVPLGEIDPLIENLVMDKKVVIKGEKVFAAQWYYAELNCANELTQLVGPVKFNMLPSELEAIETKLETLAAELGMELDELQLSAVREAICQQVFILTGGPGTGKTTTINMMIHYFLSEGLDLFLAAPTGRAAKRMTEATGYEARTIHRMLELNSAISDEGSHGMHFERNLENPLEADVIIIDEMSMVDVQLFQALLRAVPMGARLILVGDVNQLPSVGAGQVLKDLIASKAFPMVELKRIFRQAEKSNIIVNAHKINDGEQIDLKKKAEDFYFVERKDVNQICEDIVTLITRNLPNHFGISASEIQVLTPMRKGHLGCEGLNAYLQNRLNPPGPQKKEWMSGQTTYREGDKVMQIKNNYQLEWEIVSKYNIPVDSGLGVFNGDMGRILEIDERAQTVLVEFDDQRRVTYPFSGLDELELSYAVTIHKSQGSEYPAVILPLLGGPRMLFNRNLLYTAITRAKSCVMILGSSDTVHNMIENEDEHKRYTALADRIADYGMSFV